MNTENENLAQAIKMIIKYENSINRAVRKYIIKDNMVLNNILNLSSSEKRILFTYAQKCKEYLQVGNEIDKAINKQIKSFNSIKLRENTPKILIITT